MQIVYKKSLQLDYIPHVAIQLILIALILRKKFQKKSFVSFKYFEYSIVTQLTSFDNCITLELTFSEQKHDIFSQSYLLVHKKRDMFHWTYLLVPLLYNQ